MTPIQRVMEQTERIPGVDCWLFTGTTNPSGYGAVHHGGKTLWAHRIALADKLGRPLQKWALHHCDVQLCVRPDHLYEGTAKDNRRDAIVRKRLAPPLRMLKCVNGHDYTPENSKYVRRGVKLCRACLAKYRAQWRANNLERERKRDRDKKMAKRREAPC